jgi:hypothetical protein
VGELLHIETVTWLDRPVRRAKRAPA